MTTIKKIINIRKQVGLTQKDLAEKYKIPVRTIADWERGARKPPEYVVELLLRCMVLDFPMEPVFSEPEPAVNSLKRPKLTHTIYRDYGNKPYPPELSKILLAEFLAGRVQVIEETKFSHEDDNEEPVPATHKYGKLYLCTDPDYEKGIPLGCTFRVVTKEE